MVRGYLGYLMGFSVCKPICMLFMDPTKQLGSLELFK